MSSLRPCGGVHRARINAYLAAHPECRGNPRACPELMEMFRAWAQELNARLAALRPLPPARPLPTKAEIAKLEQELGPITPEMEADTFVEIAQRCPRIAWMMAYGQAMERRERGKQGNLGGTMALQNAYGYIAMKEGGRALVKINPGQKTGYVYATGRTVPLRGLKISNVPRRALIHKVAPSVMFDADTNPDILYAVQVENIDLEGGLPLGPAAEDMMGVFGASAVDEACAGKVATTVKVAAITYLASAGSAIVGIGMLFTKRKGLAAGLLAGGVFGYVTSRQLAIGAARTFDACRTAAAPRA